MSVIVTTNEALSAAILDVLDEGVRASNGFKLEWFEGNDDGLTPEDWVNAERLNFRDAVLKRLGQLHVVPHNMAPQLENLCDRHRRELLPAATVGFCGPCERELKAKLGHQ